MSICVAEKLMAIAKMLKEMEGNSDEKETPSLEKLIKERAEMGTPKKRHKNKKALMMILVGDKKQKED